VWAELHRQRPGLLKAGEGVARHADAGSQGPEEGRGAERLALVNGSLAIQVFCLIPTLCYTKEPISPSR